MPPDTAPTTAPTSKQDHQVSLRRIERALGRSLDRVEVRRLDRLAASEGPIRRNVRCVVHPTRGRLAIFAFADGTEMWIQARAKSGFAGVERRQDELVNLVDLSPHCARRTPRAREHRAPASRRTATSSAGRGDPDLADEPPPSPRQGVTA